MGWECGGAIAVSCGSIRPWLGRLDGRGGGYLYALADRIRRDSKFVLSPGPKPANNQTPTHPWTIHGFASVWSVVLPPLALCPGRITSRSLWDYGRVRLKSAIVSSCPRGRCNESIQLLHWPCCVRVAHVKSERQFFKDHLTNSTRRSYSWVHGIRQSPAERKPLTSFGCRSNVAVGQAMVCALRRRTFSTLSLVMDSWWLNRSALCYVYSLCGWLRTLLVFMWCSDRLGPCA